MSSKLLKRVTQKVRAFWLWPDQSCFVLLSVLSFLALNMWYAYYSTIDQKTADSLYWPWFYSCCVTIYMGLSRPVKYRYFDFIVKNIAFFFTFNCLLEELGHPVVKKYWPEIAPYLFNPHRFQLNEIIILAITVIVIIRGAGERYKKPGTKYTP